MCNFPPPPPFFPFFPNHLTNYSKTWAYDGKNVESVAYFLNNSQICKEQYSRTLGTTTTVTINNGTQVWRLIGEDEKGRPTNIGFGSLTQQLSFDLVGRVTGRKVRYGNEPYIQNAAYEYDVATGNMMMRTDSIYGHEEAFAYDYLNRLTDNGTGGYAYDTKGNVVRRDGVGGYGYSSASPYAVSEVPFNAMIPQRDQRIHYNALQLPDSICEGGTTAIFTYGGDLQRNSMRVTRGETSLSARYYDGTFNSFHRLRGENLDVKQILYLAGDAYTAPAAMVRDYGSGIWQLRHILRDNQSSIVAIADTAGNVIERNDYDPWGVRRQPQTLSPFSPGEAPELLLGRGYCGHEHLTEFGLINMNARLFDPALCRFLSPDPIVQAPDNSQNFNRYSYCLNNPLRYTDPTGLIVTYGEDDDNRLYEFIQDLRRISKLFNQLYTYLNEDQNNEYVVEFGEQNNSDNNGQYNTVTNRITFNKNKALVTQVVSEEFYHAFQEMMKKMNQSPNWNREYEAKIASIMICAEAGKPSNYPMAPFDVVSSEIYCNACVEGLNYYTQNFESFVDLYMNTAPLFLLAYRNANPNHSYPILFFPNTLKFFLFNEK